MIRIMLCSLSPLHEFGVDPGEVIRQVGLDRGSSRTRTTLFHMRPLDACSRPVSHTHCPHFGLLLGQRGTLSSLGPIGGLLQHSATVGEACRPMSDTCICMTVGAALRCWIMGTWSPWAMRSMSRASRVPSRSRMPPWRWQRMCYGRCVGRIGRLRRCCCPDASPPILDRTGASSRRPCALIRKPPPWSFRPVGLTTASRARTRSFAKFSRLMFGNFEAAGASDWKDSLRRMLRTEILTTRCSAATIADRFAVHRRTLSRHLQAEGWAFRALSTRPGSRSPGELMTRILLSEIAVALGYLRRAPSREPSAAGRAIAGGLAHGTWSGLNPVIQLLDRRTTTGDRSARHRPADGLDRGTDTKAGDGNPIADPRSAPQQSEQIPFSTSRSIRLFCRSIC